ncbi:hypothetical protein SBV1_3670001 [Verrucomicrobia bacterium]|nr:hypothetical protein SBV1_3670001 [Verrucomicrobiota bacterium]
MAIIHHAKQVENLAAWAPEIERTSSPRPSPPEEAEEERQKARDQSAKPLRGALFGPLAFESGSKLLIFTRKCLR